jgi:hypothetical protein
VLATPAEAFEPNWRDFDLAAIHQVPATRRSSSNASAR